MPYNPDKPPSKLHNLSEVKQRQWVHVFNASIAAGDDEETAHKKAWGTVNKSAEECCRDLLDFNKGFFGDARRKLTGSPTPKPASGFSPETRRAFRSQAKQQELRREPMSTEWEAFKPGRQRRRNPATGKPEYRDSPERQAADEKQKAAQQRAAAEKKGEEKKPEGAKDTGGVTSTMAIDSAKVDSANNKLLVTTTDEAGNKKTVSIPMGKLDNFPDSLKRKLLDATVAASYEHGYFSDLDNAVLLHLVQKHSETLLSYAVPVCKDSDDESAEALSETEMQEEPKIDVTTPAGARTMALSLTRILGGWKGGCRLSPSANRKNLYHITVFCDSPEEVGKRILQIRDHLLGMGYQEAEEGMFRLGGRTVYQGRTYARRRGNRPLAFMVTVECKD